MLPTILSKQLEEGLKDFVTSTYPMANKPFKSSLEQYVNTENALFREPFISIKLPFRPSNELSGWFDAVEPKFPPHTHQAQAFDRLKGEDGHSTVIATGTGSGKTECFVYPILDYCYNHYGENGIKALLIYPMNALASDQAERIAEEIYRNEKLKGKIKVGMYVGGEDNTATTEMGERHVITSHEVMLNEPPDILMTNYKMLDYLLVRPKDAGIWKNNSPDTLKYIAVDELHTFDGAQGTDLACLIRRLKARLYIQPGYLCCIGTSATLGDSGGGESIKQYAEKIFGEQFEDDCVITENRLSADEYFLDIDDDSDYKYPDAEEIQKLKKYLDEDDEENFLRCAASAWLTDFNDDVLSEEGRIHLGKALKNHRVFQELIRQMDGQYWQLSELLEEIRLGYSSMNEIEDPQTAVNALIALVSHARTGTPASLRPFLNVQVQLWMRELRRLMGKVEEELVTYKTVADVSGEEANTYLPVVNCRECGMTGWATVLDEKHGAELTNLRGFYNKFFEGDTKITFLYPDTSEREVTGLINGTIDPVTMQVDIREDNQGRVSEKGYKLIPIRIANKLNAIGRPGSKQIICPYCGGRHSLTLLGLRSTTEISNAVSQMFASKFNDDKKLIAFSDNVQDAAHKAGFLNARSWRFGLRIAIQNYVNHGGVELKLRDFQNGFLSYWHSKMSKEEFAGYFTAPNMTWYSEYEALLRNRKIPPHRSDRRNLLEDIEKRLSYEILLEYGLLSKEGRSLKTSYSSALYFDKNDIELLTERIYQRAQNELEDMSEYTKSVFQHMIIGYLNLMVESGAFADKVFNMFVNDHGNSYLLTDNNVQYRWMPGPAYDRYTAHFPVKWLYHEGRSETFDDIYKGKYPVWINKCLGNKDQFLDKSAQISWFIIEEAMKIGLIEKVGSMTDCEAYGISLDHVFITDQVYRVRCNNCGTSEPVAYENLSFVNEGLCRSIRCDGMVFHEFSDQPNFYGKLYNTADPFRINANEHTGLLENSDRKKLEKQFKKETADQMSFDTNVLSCTPTMEMGVDIGALSTVLLCNIPPQESSFVQRAGRGGRRDGNALTLVVANTRPHDLYFYEDPNDMVNGIVQPPRVFLDASAVLQRQFIAYAMDSWIKKGAKEDSIPSKMIDCIQAVENKEADHFPFNFIDYVKDHAGSLKRSFVRMFQKDELSKETTAAISLFIEGKGMKDLPVEVKILEPFENVNAHKKAIEKNIQELDIRVSELRKKPKDSSIDIEIDELRQEKKALQGVIREINKEGVFEFMSDEGLLPNYAFPESGVVLKAVMYHKEASEQKDDGKLKKTQKDTYKYSRSASSAISEFSPDNTFYANGHQMKIDRIDVNTKEVVKWRLCPNCSHAQENSQISSKGACPVCGSSGWADSGQVKDMLKVQMVYSKIDSRDSVINDSSDDRTSVYYKRQLLVDVDEKDVVSAYEMDNNDFQFGFDFVRKATIREINFGKEEFEGNRMTVAGEQAVRNGFKICRHCGTVQGRREKPKHTGYCIVKRNPNIAEAYSDCLFLYRELETEVLRLLIPSTSFDSSAKRTDSFVAAFMLGLREHFGNVNHLQSAISTFPLAEQGQSKRYLVIYDTVPGGTGYLQQLVADKNTLVTIFEKALRVLESCDCRLDGRDGCYHCLYAYRSTASTENISRKEATKILSSIISGKGNIERINTLGEIKVNHTVDSELERLFIEEAILEYTKKRATDSLSKSVVNTKDGYILRINGNLWEIEPQVDLDAEQNVMVKSRPDFVFWPKRTNQKDINKVKPIAVFTDGFTYHKDEVDDDTLKRNAIKQSGNFIVWSLTYNDVKSTLQPMTSFSSDVFDHNNLVNFGIVSGYTGVLGGRKIEPRKGAFNLLMAYLESPDIEVFETYAKAYAMAAIDIAIKNDHRLFDEWSTDVNAVDKVSFFLDDPLIFGDTLFGQYKAARINALLSIYSGISQSKLRDNSSHAPVVLAILEDREDKIKDNYQKEWNGFWNYFNLMQFLPEFIGVTRKGLEKSVYTVLKPNTTAPVALNNEWDTLKEELGGKEECQFIDKISNLLIPHPKDIFYDLDDGHGEVIALLTIAWPDQKICYLAQPEITNRAIIESLGWKVLDKDSEINEGIWRAN